MSKLLLKDFEVDGICEVCGKKGKVTDNECHACAAKRCFTRGSNKDASCNILCDRKVGDTYLPCFKIPICSAIRAGKKDWRNISPLREVDYNGIVGK